MLLSSIARRDRRANVVLGARLLTNRSARRVWSDMFARGEYLDCYPDVAEANVPPAPLSKVISISPRLGVPAWRVT